MEARRGSFLRTRQSKGTLVQREPYKENEIKAGGTKKTRRMFYGEDVEEGRSTRESAQPGHFRGGGGWRKKDGEPGTKRVAWWRRSV